MDQDAIIKHIFIWIKKQSLNDTTKLDQQK